MTPLSILFPTDFSDRANQALKQAIYFAEQTNSKLLIYHVYHQPYSESGSVADMGAKMERLENRIETSFNQYLAKYPDLEKVEHQFKKEKGISIEKIVETANRKNIDLIITATKGAKGFGELWGTKTEKILREVNVPALIIPDHSSISDISKIALACDYSKKTKYQSLELMVDIAEHFHSDVDVISFHQDVLTQDNDMAMTFKETGNRELVKTLLEDINTTFCFTFKEDIQEGIIRYCKENEVNMITILPKEYSFIERLFRESLTKKMIFQSPFPLLVLK